MENELDEITILDTGKSGWREIAENESTRSSKYESSRLEKDCNRQRDTLQEIKEESSNSQLTKEGVGEVEITVLD